MVWKQKEEAAKSTTTPPKSNKIVWKPKEVQSSMSTSLGPEAPSCKNWREKNSLKKNYLAGRSNTPCGRIHASRLKKLTSQVTSHKSGRRSIPCWSSKHRPQGNIGKIPLDHRPEASFGEDPHNRDNLYLCIAFLIISTMHYKKMERPKNELC